MNKIACFRVEASPRIGAGHAMRCSVLADALVEQGWHCKFITSSETYSFIENLQRFEKVDSERFYNAPIYCDLLVVDHYDLNESYEKYFRPFAKKIMVIDDLANRKHDCDILLDQTYGREVEDYKSLVPEYCKIFTGSDYVLLRKEFVELRSKALEKRRKTKKIRNILISMGGGSSCDHALKSLEIIKKSQFKGSIDIVLGFTSNSADSIKSYIKDLPNDARIHFNADMPKLIYEADLAIGAAGSSAWERCCLGLPSILMQTACNQNFCFSKMADVCTIASSEDHHFETLLKTIEMDFQNFVSKSAAIVKGQGTKILITYLQEMD